MVKTLGIEQFAPMNHIYRFYELNDYMKSIAEIGYHSMDLWTCGSHYFVDSNNYEDGIYRYNSTESTLYINNVKKYTKEK